MGRNGVAISDGKVIAMLWAEEYRMWGEAAHSEDESNQKGEEWGAP